MPVNVDQFAAAVLHSIGAPVTPKNIAGIQGWAQAEGGAPHNNPLNTTQGAPGASNFNSVGVKSYPDFQTAVNATTATLKNGRYGAILGALRASDPNALAAAIGSSPWGTSAALVRQTIASALGSHPQVPTGGLGRNVTYQVPGQKIQSTIGGGLNTEALALAVLEKEASKPINTSGKVTAGSGLRDVADAVDSGLYQAPTQQVTSQLPPTHGSLRMNGSSTSLDHITGKGDNLNPISTADGWRYGRTDQGVDAAANVGAPIKAINDSRVVEIVPNWYAGQPLVLLQLTGGPDAGKYWYVSEQITNHVHVGQQVGRGQLVATYAPSGTGIEIGWGDPHSGGRTLAQAQGNTGDASHNNAPAGIDFRNKILR